MTQVIKWTKIHLTQYITWSENKLEILIAELTPKSTTLIKRNEYHETIKAQYWIVQEMALKTWKYENIPKTIKEFNRQK